MATSGVSVPSGLLHVQAKRDDDFTDPFGLLLENPEGMLEL